MATIEQSIARLRRKTNLAKDHDRHYVEYIPREDAELLLEVLEAL